MSSSLYEIVELSSGEIALRRSDDDGEPLVYIRFSEESEFHLREQKIEIAKAMIEAGIYAAAEMADEEVDMEFNADLPEAGINGIKPEKKTVH